MAHIGYTAYNNNVVLQQPWFSKPLNVVSWKDTSESLGDSGLWDFEKKIRCFIKIMEHDVPGKVCLV